MKYIQKKHTTLFWICCRNLFLLFFSCLNINLFAQHKSEWVDIHLIDTNNYTEFTVDKVFSQKYPPNNLFDSKLNTCWVNGADNDLTSIYLKLPTIDTVVLNVFAGYGKSHKLFMENAKPQNLKLTFYFGINPEGFVSENGAVYKSVKLPFEQICELADTFAIQSVQLNIDRDKLTEYKSEILNEFTSDYKLPVASSIFIVKMEVLNTISGNKYDDVCISELYFNDCLTSIEKSNFKSVSELYLNQDENILLSKDVANNETMIYSDTSSILQIIEVSDDKKWAILISMPTEIEGRVETEYILVNIPKKAQVNSQLESIAKNYSWGEFIYFETDQRNRLYIMYDSENGDNKIELR